jgi:hypothetical protein
MTTGIPELFKSTEWLPDSPSLNMLDYCVWNELKQLMYKPRENLVSSCRLLQQINKNAWPPVSQENISSAISCGKRWVLPAFI